jgi:hypothetical protein
MSSVSLFLPTRVGIEARDFRGALGGSLAQIPFVDHTFVIDHAAEISVFDRDLPVLRT